MVFFKYIKYMDAFAQIPSFLIKDAYRKEKDKQVS
jgi:hypothetical protein